ncbi:uncharacterized protein LOC9654811 isoform X1 [Selaginella moellendorffii]|nr:uncharacterized protein LOC9654811 isoform X1 [Selaginella moellendorffii]|eukprot:XP_024524411.1 uncharacterized protein LOC9654811 isoform X1 [Selaginella moellendorffii]
MGDTKKKCLGRFETSYMRAMAPPEPSDYPPRTRDYGQYMKVLNNIEMNKKFQFPMGLPKYKYDFCDEKYPLPGEKKKPSKPPLKYKPSCPQYAPYHSTMQDMSLIQRRLDTEPEQEHTWYRDKTDSMQMKKLGQIKEQLDSLKQLFVEERGKCQDLEVQLERLRAKSSQTPRRREVGISGSREETPRINERLLTSSEADKVLSWLASFDEGGGGGSYGNNASTAVASTVFDRQKSPRKTWAFKDQVCLPGFHHSREKVMQAWMGFEQGEKETIGDYSERFWKLRMEMMGVQSLSNEEQLRRFTAGLKFKIRNEVTALRPGSLSDAILLAERAEARSAAKTRPTRAKSKKLPRKASVIAETAGKKPRQLQLLSPVEQIQYLNRHSSCGCRKEDLPPEDQKQQQ